MEEIEELRRLLREEQLRREAEERRREEAESRALEEQRRREEAEELAEASQPHTLGEYLEACHSLNLAIQVVGRNVVTEVTQGSTVSFHPFGRRKLIGIIRSNLYGFEKQQGTC